MPLQYERFQKKRVQQDTTKQRICYWQRRHEHHVTREGREKTNSSGGAWKAHFMDGNHSKQQEGPTTTTTNQNQKTVFHLSRPGWGGGVQRWGWGDSEFDFSLLNKVPIKSMQLTADNYFQLAETVLKLLIRLPAKRTKCVYSSRFQKGGKGDLGVRWGRTLETERGIRARRELLGALRGPASDKPRRQGRWGGQQRGGCGGGAPRGGGAAARCIHGARARGGDLVWKYST